MNFLNPVGLWFSLISIPIIIFYFLKIRRKRTDISSTLLWRLAIMDKQANAPWQKLRRNLLLLLQLIILSLLVLAIARLAFPASSISSGAVVLLIDGSASMQAEDVEPTRFAEAIEIAKQLVRETNPDTVSSAILMTHQPVILFAQETDKNRALDILSLAEPGNSEADWQAAFSIASGMTQSENSTELTYIVLSDGGVPAGESLPLLPGAVRYIPIGTNDDNLAISAISARSSPADDFAELFIRITNYGTQNRSGILTVLRNGERLYTGEFQLTGGTDKQLVVEKIPLDNAAFTATISNIQSNLPLDFFQQDDIGFAVLSPAPTRQVLLVSKGNLFLERLLLLLPNIEPSKTTADEVGQVNLPDDGFDVVILDGIVPADNLPDANFLLINPPAHQLFSTGEFINQLSDLRPTDHELSQFIAWDLVHVFKTRRLILPERSQILLETDESPLIYVRDHDGQRIAVIGFDLQDSDLPIQPAFPILFANLFDFLAPQGIIEKPNGTRPNESLQIYPPLGTRNLIVTQPTGAQQTLPVSSDRVTYSDTEIPGIYTVAALRGDSLEEAQFAITPLSALESDLRVKKQMQIGQLMVNPADEQEISNQEVWLILIILALVFLLIEWTAYHRRSA